MGPDAQYVGKVRVFTSRHRTQISFVFHPGGKHGSSVLRVVISPSVLVYWGSGLQQELPVLLQRRVGVALAHIIF